MTATTTTRLGLIAVGIASLFACSNSNGPAITVSVSPAAVTIQVNGGQQFSATVTNTTNTGVTWSVSEGASGGSISATGLYSAPATAGTFHIIATSVADTTKIGGAIVTVAPAGSGITSVGITPSSAALRTGATQQFSALVNGAVSTAVTWSIAPGGVGGTIDQTGLYTAPQVTGRDAVIATSTVDSTRTAVAAVTVTFAAAPALSYSPSALICTLGTPCSLAAPINSGGAFTAIAIQPALPAGLSFNNTTGAISGTPTAISATRGYAVSASNAGGTSTTGVSVTVNDIPASQITYSSTSLICTVNVACSIAGPSTTGGAVLSYSVSPALPAGLSFDPASGAISGTATSVMASSAYSITGTNTGGATRTTLNISVINAAPAQLAYGESELICTIDTPCGIAAPTNTGGAPLSYSINPTLPPGLNFDPATGAISGTPTILSPSRVYVVIAFNSGGSAVTELSVAVNDLPPTDLSYPRTTIICTKGSPCTVQPPISSGGAVISYAVNPPLPTGLSIATQSGAIAGTPTVVAVAADYTVTATNTGGSTTATVNITVRDVPPTEVNYYPPTVICLQGTFCTLGPPVNSGGTVVTYTILPALPNGLNLSPTTGVITGTSTVTSETTNYIVTGTNSGGAGTTRVTITVNEAAPANLVYNPNSLICSINASCSLGAPNHTAGPVDQFTISPDLPPGLTINAATGAITGTPTELSPTQSYTVTATNGTGSTTAQVSVTVGPGAPAQLTYEPTELDCNVGSFCSLAPPSSTGGAVASYSISPALPAGLALDTSGGISGTPTAASAAQSYVVTASNGSGSATATITILVSNTGPWTPIGPDGGRALSIAIDPGNASNLFAVMRGGAVFHSTNAATTWTASGSGLEGQYPQMIAFGPGGSLYAATQNGGVFTSTNSGATWTQLALAARTLNVAADFNAPGTLYAGVVSGTDNVYKSTDNGANWAPSDTGMDQGSSAEVFTVPSIPGLLYASNQLHVYKSVDSAATWTEIDSGIGGQTAGLAALAVDPIEPTKLYIPSPGDDVVYSSSDGGTDWTASSSFDAGSQPQTVIVDPSNDHRLFLATTGVPFVSTDFGADWMQLITTVNNAQPVAVSTTGTIYVSDVYGIYASTDNGETWPLRSSGLEGTEVSGVTVAPDGTLYGTGAPGTFASVNHGASWNQLDTLAGKQVLVDPAAPANLIVLVNDGTVETSSDGGSGWQQNTSVNFNQLAMPADGGPMVYAGAVFGGVSISQDDGVTWNDSSTGMSSGGLSLSRSRPAVSVGGAPQIVSVAVQADDATHVLAVGNNEVFLSTDSGASWTQITTGLPSGGEIYRAASGDPTLPNTFYLASDASLYVSSNGGNSFSLRASLPQSLSGGSLTRFVAVSPANHTIFLGTPTGLLSSIDSGATFQVLTAGLISTDVRALAFFGGTTFAATGGGGVEASSTGGR